MPQVFLGCESLRAGNGGICRVARLMAKVLAEEVEAGRIKVRGSILSDEADYAENGLHFRTCRKSRRKFVIAANRALLNTTHFLYDCGGMARAHNWLPFPKRPFLTFIMGIEVWPGTAHLKQAATTLKADKLLAISSYTRERARTLDPRFEKAEICWISTEFDDPPEAKAQVDGPPRVLILARIDAYKGHEELIRCWPRVLAAVPDAVLTIAGNGSEKERYQKLAAELGLGERVEFLGFVPESEIDALWRRTTVFAMPSRGEGFGLVYIEAMRYGIPVIGSICDAAPEVNLDGETGYNVSLETLEPLGERLIELLKNRDAAARMGRAGFVRWQQHFRYSGFRDRFRPILQRFLA